MTNDRLLQVAYSFVAAALVATWMTGIVFWTYFAGAVLLALGLTVVIKKDMPKLHGVDKLLPFGRVFFAVPLGVFAAEHFTITKIIATGVPAWIPGHIFWVYLVGAALVAAAISIILEEQSRLAAILLGIMIASFVLLLHIPKVVAQPHDRIAWAVALRDLSFSGGALAFGGARSKALSSGKVHWLVTLGRLLIAIGALFFSIEHFMHPTFVPAVPLGQVMPEWLPARLFWAYFAGVALLVCGACLLINKRARLAATCFGGVVFLVVLFVYLPILISKPADVGNGMNYFADTLMYCGAILVLAEALPKEGLPSL
ncbi:MAG: hypothetical protein WBG02_04025 [Candidatus Acidiferrum sp.]